MALSLLTLKTVLSPLTLKRFLSLLALKRVLSPLTIKTILQPLKLKTVLSLQPHPLGETTRGKLGLPLPPVFLTMHVWVPGCTGTRMETPVYTA